MAIFDACVRADRRWHKPGRQAYTAAREQPRRVLQEAWKQDSLYVNGVNVLENQRCDDQTWKVRLIEEEFRRLMFDVEDV